MIDLNTVSLSLNFSSEGSTILIGKAQYFVSNGDAIYKSKELTKKIISNTGITNFATAMLLPKIADSNVNERLLRDRIFAVIYQDSHDSKERIIDFLEVKKRVISK